ncbi:hypothetical protein HID58_095098 [Brassica napus]|uniref:Transposase MuDR plant domain-containing protein n=1 Tax=Brassica napus TaxID=3708 RepID=A0ABQ7X7E3_BRANA|nr:hypothetical protein HID58_095098 [Brassica napus]
MSTCSGRERTRTVKERIKVVLDLCSPNLLFNAFKMGQLVKLVVGVWEQVSTVGWLFLEDPTERNYDVMVHESQTYASLMDLVRTRYSVDAHTAVALTYEFPKWMKVSGDGSTPPGDNRDNYTVIGSSMGSVPPSTFCCQGYNAGNHISSTPLHDLHGPLHDSAAYWEGMLAQGWQSSNQQLLLDICTDDEYAYLPKNNLSMNKRAHVTSVDSSEGTQSSTDSSTAPSGVVPTHCTGGILGLAEDNLPPVNRPSMALTIGEGKVSDAVHVGQKRERPRIDHRGCRPNPNFPDPLLEEDSTDEGSQDEGPDFCMSVRRSEPGKMVLECKGVECPWRVSAAKLPGCPRFQIKRLNEEHTCTVDERRDFTRHATSNLIGEMVRSKYDGVGSGPKPGSLREFMRTDHQVPITYW